MRLHNYSIHIILVEKIELINWQSPNEGKWKTSYWLFGESAGTMS